MKSLLSILAILCYALNAKAQDCPPIEASYTLDHGRIRHLIQKGNSNYNEYYLKEFDPNTAELSFVPLIKSENLWIGGSSRAGSLFTTKGSYEEQDWKAGYIGDDIFVPNPETCAYWDTIYVVTKNEIKKATEIIKHRLSCDEIPESIMNWPAKGNPNIPEQFSSSIMASFVDQNNNGIYEPCKGDIPFPPIEVLWASINNYPKEMTFNVYRSINYNPQSNDYKTSHEVIEYNLTFDSPMAKNTIFKIQQIRNIGNEDIIDMYVSHWIDFELGCGDNDFIGTSPEHDLVYAYNSSYEECNEQVKGDSSPIVGSMLISGPHLPYIKANINGIDTFIQPIPGSGTSDTSIQSRTHSIIPYTDDKSPIFIIPENLELYNQIRGMKKNGAPYLDPNEEETLYPLDGNPLISESNSMCTYPAESNYSLLNIGPALSQPGSFITLMTATFLSEDQPNGCVNSNAIKYKSKELIEFRYDSYFNPIHPPPPSLKATFRNNETMELALYDIPYSYRASNQNHPLTINHKYHFEGVKIYQVSNPDLDLSLLNNPLFSRIVYQGDLVNGIDSISDWRPIFHPNSISFGPSLRIAGKNRGIENRITLDYDMLNDQPIHTDSTYYFLAMSYGHFKAEDFDTTTGIGQKYLYIESNEDLHIISSEKALKNQKPPFTLTNQINNVSLNNITSELDIEMYNISGQFQKLNTGITKHKTILTNSDNVPGGVYIIRIKDNITNNYWTYKILKIE